jgi:hypothetical protein
MAQDPRQQYAQMLSALPPNALDRMKKELRRRAALFALGGTIVVIGAFLTLQPVYLPTIIMLVGGSVALIGLLGLTRGTGCMAYVAGFFWLSAMSCGVARGSEATLYVLAGAAGLFALAALLIPKPKAQNPLADIAKMMQGGGMGGAGGMPGSPFMPFMNMQPPGGPGPAGPDPKNVLGSQRPARERVIDVDAQEKSDAGKKRK